MVVWEGEKEFSRGGLYTKQKTDRERGGLLLYTMLDIPCLVRNRERVCARMPCLVRNRERVCVCA